MRVVSILPINCSHLGGYFAKFGQMLSSMERSIPPEFIKELSKCQDNLSAVPFSEFVRVIREDLGQKPEDIFEAVDDVPIGCASLAQVHRGTLKTGEDVAIKVQYPTVARNTQVDLRNMELVTKLCSKIFKHFQYDVRPFEEIHRSGLFQSCEVLLKVSLISPKNSRTWSSVVSSSFPLHPSMYRRDIVNIRLSESL